MLYVFTEIEEALSTVQSVGEVNSAIMLTHHLLRNLAVNQTYVVNNHYSERSTICVCGKQPYQEITGIFGDTSIGR